MKVYLLMDWPRSNEPVEWVNPMHNNSHPVSPTRIHPTQTRSLVRWVLAAHVRECSIIPGGKNPTGASQPPISRTSIGIFGIGLTVSLQGQKHRTTAGGGM